MNRGPSPVNGSASMRASAGKRACGNFSSTTGCPVAGARGCALRDIFVETRSRSTSTSGLFSGATRLPDPRAVSAATGMASRIRPCES